MPYQKSPEICPVCKKKADFKFIQDHRNEKGEWSLYECLECQVKFWLPMKNPGRDEYATGAESWRIYNLPKKRIKLSWQHKEFIKNFKNRNNQGKRLLDLGCGTGEFLNAAQKLGFEVWGVDFDRIAIGHAKSLYNLKNIYNESIEDFFSRNNIPKFDVITSFELIEHLNNIPPFFNSVVRAGKEGSYIILSTPNCKQLEPNDLKFGDSLPKHLTFWDIHSLKYVLSLYNIYIEDYKYGNEVEHFITGYFRFNTIQRLKEKSQKENNQVNKFLKTAQILNFIYTLAQIKERFLTPIAWLIVKTKKIFNIYKWNTIFLIGRISNSKVVNF